MLGDWVVLGDSDGSFEKLGEADGRVLEEGDADTLGAFEALG